MKFISKKRIFIVSVISLLLEFYAFNFIPRNVNIIATRTIFVKILDYTLNFLIFFLAIYLVSTLIIFIVEKLKK